MIRSKWCIRVCAALAVLAIAAVLRPAPASAVTPPYTLTTGVTQQHSLVLGDNPHVATFSARKGVWYRVRVKALPAGFYTYVLATLTTPAGERDAALATSWEDSAYIKSSVDQTATVELQGSWDGTTGCTYLITLMEYLPMSIEGTARDLATGEPLPGMTVTLMSQEWWNTPAFLQSTTTDASGHYRLDIELPDGYDESWNPFMIVGFSDPSGLREGEFASNVSYYADAVHFPFSSAAHITGVDGRLGLPWGFDAILRDGRTGEPMPGGILRIFEPNAVGWWVPTAQLTADAQGRVQFQRSARQSVRIQLEDPSGTLPPQFLGQNFDVWDAPSTHATAGTTVHTDLVCTAGTSIAGVVLDSSTSSPLARAKIEAWRNTQRDGWVIARSTTSRADGSYSLAVLPGSYRLRASDPTGLHKDRWNGGAADRATTPDLRVGSSALSNDFRLFSDMLPPVTDVSHVPAWAKGPVLLSLNAHDAGEGVAATYYRAGIRRIQPYIAPVTITSEGLTEVLYWSVDRAGNTEARHQLSVHIDYTPPSVATGAEPNYATEAAIRITGSDRLSGVAAVAYRVDGGDWVVESSTVATARITAPGRHILESYCVDSVGNESTHSTSFFTVGDVSTSCTMIAQPVDASYDSLVTITGTVTVSAGYALGAVVGVERSTDGVTYASTGETACVNADGTYTLAARVQRNCLLRVRCLAAPGLIGSVTPPVTVTCTASLPTPFAPSSAYASRSIKITGSIAPGHPAGIRVVKIRCFRRENGRYVLRASFWATSKSGAASSSYVAYLKLPRGVWRICSRHSDASHASSDSKYRSITVR